VPGLAVAVVAGAFVRARHGVDLTDSSHVVEPALRLTQGDVPFRDEMNVQALPAAYHQKVVSYKTTAAPMYLLAVCCRPGATVRRVRYDDPRRV
jgi:hypothetical protein